MIHSTQLSRILLLVKNENLKLVVRVYEDRKPANELDITHINEDIGDVERDNANDEILQYVTGTRKESITLKDLRAGSVSRVRENIILMPKLGIQLEFWQPMRLE